jgi:hypothetical protein
MSKTGLSTERDWCKRVCCGMLMIELNDRVHELELRCPVLFAPCSVPHDLCSLHLFRKQELYCVICALCTVLCGLYTIARLSFALCAVALRPFLCVLCSVFCAVRPVRRALYAVVCVSCVLCAVRCRPACCSTCHGCVLCILCAFVCASGLPCSVLFAAQ